MKRTGIRPGFETVSQQRATHDQLRLKQTLSRVRQNRARELGNMKERLCWKSDLLANASLDHEFM